MASNSLRIFVGRSLSLKFLFKEKQALFALSPKRLIDSLKEPAAFILSPRYTNLARFERLAFQILLLFTLFFFWKVIHLVLLVFTFISHSSQNL